MTADEWKDLARRAIDVARVSDDPATRESGKRLYAEEMRGDPMERSLAMNLLRREIRAKKDELDELEAMQ